MANTAHPAMKPWQMLLVVILVSAGIGIIFLPTHVRNITMSVLYTAGYFGAAMILFAVAVLEFRRRKKFLPVMYLFLALFLVGFFIQSASELIKMLHPNR